MAIDTELNQDTKLDLDHPSLWGVKFLNDDYTPMDFVIAVLIRFFKQSEEEAYAVTMKVHNDGEAIVGAYPKDIAITKAYNAENSARQMGHPLRLQPTEI